MNDALQNFIAAASAALPRTFVESPTVELPYEPERSWPEGRAVLKLESIGDGLQHLSRMMSSGQFEVAMGAAQAVGRMHGRMKDFAMCPRGRPWVARITAAPGARIEREFVRGNKDYLEASSTGNRGVHYWFTMTGGVYEVFEHLSWKRSRRYFARVEGGEIIEITEEEMRRCLNSSDRSARTSSPPAGSGSPGPSTRSLASMLASAAGRTAP